LFVVFHSSLSLNLAQGVPRACDIWTLPLTKVKNLVTDNKHPGEVSYVSLKLLAQGVTTERPAVHDAIIWERTDRAFVGHIAIVSEVTDDYVRIAEQNVDNDVMWKGGSFTRQFPLVRNLETSAWTIKDDEDPIHGMF
jgi:hypothetical protein